MNAHELCLHGAQAKDVALGRAIELCGALEIDAFDRWMGTAGESIGYACIAFVLAWGFSLLLFQTPIVKHWLFDHLDILANADREYNEGVKNGAISDERKGEIEKSAGHFSGLKAIAVAIFMLGVVLAAV